MGPVVPSSVWESVQETAAEQSGQNFFARWAPKMTSSHECLRLAAVFASRCGVCPFFAGPCGGSSAAAFDSPSAGSAVRSTEILPIPLVLAKPFFAHRILSLPSSLDRLVDVCLGVVCALNGLYAYGLPHWQVNPGCRFHLSEPQITALNLVLSACSVVWSDPPLPFALDVEVDLLRHAKLDYSGKVASVRRDLIAKKVIPAWPAVGSACVAPIADFIDLELREDVLDPFRCLLPRSEWPAEPPRSRVYASDPEWFELCRAGHERKMFVPVEEAEVFKDQHGNPVLSGAMGVDKVKVVEGESIHLLRFIAILTPINAFLRKLRGDSPLLPQASLLTMMLLDADEVAVVSCEDLESCFNVFYLPDAWRGFFVFSKKVPLSAFGGDAGKLTYVGLRCVPMGWTNSVDLIQNFIRRFVFGTCQIEPHLEVCRAQPFPQDGAAVVCMDGFDSIARVQLDRHLRGLVRDFWERAQPEKSPEMLRFVSECKRLNLPLNAGKAVFRSFTADVLGGEFDGLSGRIRVGAEKSQFFFAGA